LSSEVSLGKVDEFPDGEARRVEVDGRRLALVRIGERVFALDDRCSHANYSLSEGEVDASELVIECPKHGSAFSLEDGEALTLPATKPVGTYAVSVEDGEVKVVLP
jgi:3-phenylpropionate/trans-cinnamate dioxygenase ferredoxin subunit